MGHPWSLPDCTDEASWIHGDWPCEGTRWPWTKQGNEPSQIRPLALPTWEVEGAWKHRDSANGGDHPRAHSMNELGRACQVHDQDVLRSMMNLGWPRPRFLAQIFARNFAQFSRGFSGVFMVPFYPASGRLAARIGRESKPESKPESNPLRSVFRTLGTRENGLGNEDGFGPDRARWTKRNPRESRMVRNVLAVC